MPLTVGSRLGPYEVIGLIGAGGMGEVYRARDTKLGRDVALKILPDTFTQDPERVARFRREAQLLASLNHPHIGAIYGLDEVDGQQFLVLELIDGETLAERIATGRLPLDEALIVASQIADALEAAHERGVIHRDLKPANIKIRPDGVVKVLDFGLAKAFDPLASSGAGAMNSPTLTAAATMRGVILGTAAYMSPEQARGKTVDKRSDVWAFGCVLYEMLTGRRAFAGDEVTDTLAFVITKDVDWTALPAQTPISIRRLLGRCLEKDRARRRGDIHDVRLDIDEARASPTSESSSVAGSTAPARPAWGRRGLPWAVASVLGVGLASVLVAWAPWRNASAPPPMRLNVELGADVSLVSNQGATAVLSPDGTVLAFVAQTGGQPQIYVRRLDRLEAAPLSGTTNARGMFFSPDSQWIGFFADGKLKKIAVTGGAAVTLCDAPDDRGGAWADDGTIVFVPNALQGAGVQRVSESGGQPEPLAAIDPGEIARFPRMLPGGKALLYVAPNRQLALDDADIVVQPLPSGARKVVLRGGYDARYLASGHIVYMHEGTLFAAPFDLSRLELAGSPVPVLEGVTANNAAGSATFSVSGTGTLVYLPGQSLGSDIPISWMDRQGKVTPLRNTPSNWSNPHFSPDGRRLAVDIFDGKQTDVWVYEWARDTLSRLTFDAVDDLKPVWTPDGSRIVFRSARGQSPGNLFWQRSDGTGEVQRLTESQTVQLPASWHPTGKFLAFAELKTATDPDILILPIEGDEGSAWKPGKPTVFLNSRFVEIEPMFSPDGRWIAYQSNETGQTEVYVRPFPGPGGKWQISTGGGAYPTWSRTRSELFYTGITRQIMVARYAVEGDSFRADKPVVWSDRQIAIRPRQRSFDVHPDGERFAVAASQEAQTVTKIDHLRLILNFFDELRRVAPVAKR